MSGTESRPDRDGPGPDADIRLGWDLIEEGDLDGARRHHRRLAENRQDADNDAELVAFGAAIMAAAGDSVPAFTAFLRASSLDPETTRYLVHAAEVKLYSLDEPEAAVALCDRVFDLTTDEDDLIDAVLIKSCALISLGDRDDEARDLLEELEGCAVGDPLLFCRAGELQLTLADAEGARASFAQAVALDPDCADGHHGLGLACEALGDREQMVASWLRTRALDAALPAPPWQLSEDEFEAIATRALAELPDSVRDHLANVPILVDGLPGAVHVESGVDPRILGLFAGVPLPDKGGQALSLDTIYLFQRNLERVCYSREQLEAEIRTTLLHETAHFFGLDDDDLEALGLG